MSWIQRLRNVFQTDRVRRDIERELASHVAERADEFRAAGMSERDALASARRQFGNFSVQVESTRDMNISTAVDALVRNVRHALRTLLKTPVFTATVVLTLALGIGANSAVFSAIYSVLLRPLPFPEADQLVMLRQGRPNEPLTQVAPVRLTEWSRMNSVFQSITGYYTQDESELSGELPEKVRRSFTAPRFLETWGVAPALGRDFRPEEERFGGPNAVLISDRFWRRRFNADPAVTGKRLRFGQTSVPIVGVMPASFRLPDREVDLWSPSPMDAPYAQDRRSTWFNTIARLKPGVTSAQARANLETVQASLGKLHPKTDAGMVVEVQPLKDSTLGGIGRSLWVVYGSVTLLLLIACVNVAALLLARATQRQPEIALRFSLGASRFSIAAQLLTEAFLLAIAGAALGLFVAAAAARLFQTMARNLPRVEEIGLDSRIVVYTLLCAVAATLICGLIPAVRGIRGALSGSIARGARSQVASRNPLQLLLVGIQVGLAVTLLLGAGLLLRSFQELGRVAPGFDPSHILTFQITSHWGETGDPERARQFTARILDSLRTVPGVESAATSTWNMPGVPSQYQMELGLAEGRAETDARLIVEVRNVSSEYFGTLLIPLLAGELCGRDPNERGVVVNRSFANAYFQGSSPLGLHLIEPGGSRPARIHGIVGDARERGLDHAPVPTVYRCYTGFQPGTWLLVRTAIEPLAMVEAIRRKMQEVEPRRSVYNVLPLEERISEAFAQTRLRTFLLASFAVTAVLLASVGLYGTLSYLVSVRRREVGLRMALGAARRQIIGQFLRQGMVVTLAGCVAGLGLAAVSTRLLAGMLYGVSRTDPTALVSVIVIVTMVAALASLLPAVRAARVDPIQVLRDE